MLVVALIARPVEARRYIPPVAAPVVDPFGAPANPYAAGNRGIDYATTPGTPVVAVADGVVVFAGPVAGQLYVTVLHPDGIRTSYSFLAGISVAVGQQLTQGTVLGLTGSRFQIGARRGDTYLDPATLWGPPHVALVALGEASGGSPGGASPKASARPGSIASQRWPGAAGRHVA